MTRYQKISRRLTKKTRNKPRRKQSRSSDRTDTVAAAKRGPRPRPGHERNPFGIFMGFIRNDLKKRGRRVKIGRRLVD